MTDTERLDKLLASGQLSDREAEAFRHMREIAATKERLTHRQRAWVRSVYERLDLDFEETLNLHSAGKVPDGFPVSLPKSERELAGERVREHRPLKPPGAR